MNSERKGKTSKRELRKLVRRIPPCIDTDERMYNLAKGYWVYDELIADLTKAGWVRFGPGFKAGVYGHKDSSFCIKILGMGVGEDPLFFCERGYYIEHERKMLTDFWVAGFRFSPRVMDQHESIAFLKDECGVRPHQADMRVQINDLLVMEYLPGIPLAIQTGRRLNHDVNIDFCAPEVIAEMSSALRRLKLQLQRANNKELFHNDPMPPNIIFVFDEKDEIAAKLVDFELAQDLKGPCPEYVNNSVAELYRERAVPANPYTSEYQVNLDMHLLNQSIEIVNEVALAQQAAPSVHFLDPFSISIAGIGSVNLGTGRRWLQGRQ